MFRASSRPAEYLLDDSLRTMVETDHLTKRFGEIAAVDDVTMNIPEGETFGLIGPNGAGKTTLVRILNTVIPPTSGTAHVAGYDIRKDPGMVRRNIGVVTQAMTLDVELTAWENMQLYAKFYDFPVRNRDQRIRELLKLVGLQDRSDFPVASFSGGMKRRLELVRSLIHRPRVLFLDEPTTGLDLQARVSVWEYLKELHKDENVTMMITTHYLEEVENLCQRVAIIDFGRIIAIGSPDQLKRDLMGGDVIEASFSKLPEAARIAVEELPIVKRVSPGKEGNLMILVERGSEALPRIVEAVNANGGSIKSMTMREPTLDDVFLHFTGRSIREDTDIDKRRFVSMWESFRR
jgi:ABC-2 type transport system ATP-binding protein